jgi:hypothetical protein
MPRASNFGKGVKTVKTTIDMPEDLWKAAKIRALEEDRNLAELVAEAVRDFLRRKKETKHEK